MWWMLMLAACTPDPVVGAVRPGEVLAGQPIEVSGEGFAPGMRLSLAPEQGPELPLSSVEVKGVVLASAVVPESVAPGRYDVVVEVEGRSGRGLGALEVIQLPAEEPCAGLYTANTQLSLARGVIVIDRFYVKGPRKDERETLRIDLDEVERIEYELVKMKDDTLCSVIFVRTGDGRRVMFDDDTKVDLKDRAYRMASEIGKPVQVTREDAQEMGKPIERN